MHRSAAVIFEGQTQPVSCVIHDMSDSGARISIKPRAADLPLAFTLILFKNSVRRDCSVVWTDSRFIGVKFKSQWYGANSATVPAS
jgi:hypothetical protein